jgi:uncharacterized membrane protein YhhN
VALPHSRVPSRVAAGAYVALAAADSLLAAHPSPSVRRWRLVSKPLLMPALGTAFAAAVDDPDGVDDRSLLRRGTAAAHGLSWLGDVSLMSRSEPAFLAGLGSFFGAHVAYVGAFGSAGRPVTDTRGLEGVKAAGLFFAALGPSMGWLAGRRSARLRGPVVGYAAILASMFATSTRLDPAIPSDARRTVVAGTGLFLVSDLTLGVRRFVMREPGPLSDGVVMATYTAGQGLIAAGVAKAVRARRESRGSPSPGATRH